jgi:hypothetical protein
VLLEGQLAGGDVGGVGHGSGGNQGSARQSEKKFFHVGTRINS